MLRRRRAMRRVLQGSWTQCALKLRFGPGQIFSTRRPGQDPMKRNGVSPARVCLFKALLEVFYDIGGDMVGEPVDAVFFHLVFPSCQRAASG